MSSDPSELLGSGSVDVVVVDASVGVCVVVVDVEADDVVLDRPLGPGPPDDVLPEVDGEGAGGGGIAGGGAVVLVVVVVAVVVDVAVAV